MTTNLNQDLNTTIAAAVSARVEAEVARALSGDEIVGKYIAAALNQVIQIDRYDSRSKVTFLHQALRTAFQDMTKAAIAKVLADDAPLIEDEIRKAIRRSSSDLANSIVGNLVQLTSKGYGIQVTLRLPGETG